VPSGASSNHRRALRRQLGRELRENAFITPALTCGVTKPDASPVSPAGGADTYSSRTASADPGGRGADLGPTRGVSLPSGPNRSSSL